MQPNCPNCEAHLEPGYKFCPSCGQDTHLHRLSLGHIGHELVHFFTHADKGIFYLIRMLALNPGRVAREYVGGKRKRYFPPLSFFLIVAGVLVFSQTTFHRSYVNRQAEGLNRAITVEKNETIKARMTAIRDRVQNASYFTSKYSNVLAMIATPIISFLFLLFYRRAKYNYSEHLVANMYFSAFTFLWLAVVVAPLNWAIGSPGFFSVLYFLFFAFEIAYRAFAYYHFIGLKGRGPLLKAIGTSAFVILFWVSLTAFTIYNYIRSGLWGLFNGF